MLTDSSVLAELPHSGLEERIAMKEHKSIKRSDIYFVRWGDLIQFVKLILIRLI